MAFTLTEDHFLTTDEAEAEIAARRWHAVTVDLPAETNELHWHEFDSVIFVTGGTLQVAFADGSTMACGRGARVEAPARCIHREVGSAYQAVIGLSMAPAEMRMPINKPAAELAAVGGQAWPHT